jgi:hypothetical protein
MCEKVAGLGRVFKQSLDSRPERVEELSPLPAGLRNASNVDNTKTTMTATMTDDDNCDDWGLYYPDTRPGECG